MKKLQFRTLKEGDLILRKGEKYPEQIIEIYRVSMDKFRVVVGFKDLAESTIVRNFELVGNYDEDVNEVIALPGTSQEIVEYIERHNAELHRKENMTVEELVEEHTRELAEVKALLDKVNNIGKEVEEKCDIALEEAQQTIKAGNHTFEIVEEYPAGYEIDYEFNAEFMFAGIHALDGYLPLVRIRTDKELEDIIAQDTTERMSKEAFLTAKYRKDKSQLKCIRHPHAQAILNHSKRYKTLEEVEEHLGEIVDLDNYIFIKEVAEINDQAKAFSLQALATSYLLRKAKDDNQLLNLLDAIVEGRDKVKLDMSQDLIENLYRWNKNTIDHKIRQYKELGYKPPKLTDHMEKDMLEYAMTLEVKGIASLFN